MTQKIVEERLSSICVSGSLEGLIHELTGLKERYGKQGYGNLTVKYVRSCGHPFHCECSETPYVFGQRAARKDDK
jgi:hypothetical protein